MAESFGGTNPVKDTRGILPPDKKQILMAGKFLGMNSTEDPAQLDPEQGVSVVNMISRYDGLMRRDGFRRESVARPDVNRILRTHYHKQNDGTINIWRFTRDSVYRKNSSSWTAITGVLTGLDSNPIKAASCFDKIVFTNGVDKIQLIDIGANTFADLSAFAATKYKYLTVFYNRVIGAYDILNTKPTTIGWSAEYPNIDQWDSSTFPDAGSGPLIDSPNDESDFITQIAGSEEILYVCRERSIWAGTKQPSASNPFYFRTLVPSIGCDCSESVAIVPGGIVWADTTSKSIWALINNNLERIGLPIETEFFASVISPTQVQGCYNQTTQEYALLLQRLDEADPVLLLYSFKTKQWTKWNGINYGSSIGAHPYGVTNKTIDELVGTIDSLSSTIDSLGGTQLIRTSFVFGRHDGNITYTDPTIGADSSEIFPSTLGVLQAVFDSKVFTLPVTDEFIAELRVYYDCESPSVVRIYYRKNDNVLSLDDSTWLLLKEVNATMGWQKFIKFTKNIRARLYQFRVQLASTVDSGAGKTKLLRFEIQNYQAGESKR